MKKVSFIANGKKGKELKKQTVSIKPIHKVAEFTPVRMPVSLTKKFQVSMLDLFPMGIILTGNETKVLFVLRAMAIGNSNLAAIDQEQISLLTSIKRPNVARAIVGLRKKGLVKQTFMEQGLQLYRNIYELWAPPQQLEKDAKKMISQKKKVEKLKASSKKKATNFEQKFELETAKICLLCKGKGWELGYLPLQKKEVGRLCICSLAHHLAKLYSLSFKEFIPDHILELLLKQNEK